jgi:hypothetical protein
MAYSTRQVGNSIQVFDAMTGAPHFMISIAYKDMTQCYINGNTLTLSFKSGIVEVWDLDHRCRIR